MMRTRRTFVAASAALIGALAGDASAQTPDTARAGAAVSGRSVTIQPGRYKAEGFEPLFLGRGWRELWATPVTAPTLRPADYAGGLEFDKRGGGRQSITAHFKEKEGSREHVFRSVDKFPLLGVAPEIKGSAVGTVVQDQTSAFFPAGPLLVPPLLQAIGVLHIAPQLVVMEDSPVLGKERKTFAGMLGTFELKPNEGKDDKPGFAGSKKIQDTEKFMEALASGHDNRIDEREFLATRLIDFLINDSDRTADNYEWARFGEKGNYVWRPIVRDRDWAFLDSRGLINAMVISKFYPKFTAFAPKVRLNALVYSSHGLDRRLLQRLTAQDFREVALEVQQAVSDPVIQRVVDQLPAEWQTTSAPQRIKTVLRARRDNLPDIAMKFYRNLSDDVDVHGTVVADRADIMRNNDGSITVTITPVPQRLIAERREDGRVVTTSDGEVATRNEAFFRRTFHVGETDEVRVYLGDGDDVATIRGVSNSTIRVRLIGGKGNDVLADSVGAGGAYLYDQDGSDRLIAMGKAKVSTKPWNAPEVKDGLRVGSPWRPDWGGKSGFGPALDYHTSAGLIVGAGPRFKSYGFRRLPFHWTAGANFLYGTGNGRMAITGDLDYRAENSPMAFEVAARASQLEAIRFFGYGNDAPNVGRDAALVEQNVLELEPAVVRRIGWRARETDINLIRGEDTLTTGPELRPLVGKLSMGPALAWVDPEPTANAVLATSGVDGASGFGVFGARVGLELDRTDDSAVPMMGWKLESSVAAYPLVTGIGGAFGTLSGKASAYVPIVRDGLHLAMRAGGAAATENAPVQYAATLGGRSSLRGVPWRRYAGDVSANAGVELRQPVGTVNFLLRSKLGVFALADAGRVWFDGGSPGGWHTGVGGGFWLSALGKSVSVAYAQGEGSRIYIKTGLSY